MAEQSTVETLAQALAQFEMIGMHARNLATRTRSEYGRDLRDLLSYLEQRSITRLDEVRPHVLEAYLAELDRRGLRCGTLLSRRAQRGKTSRDLFYGFNLHVVISSHGDLLACRLMPGNVDDQRSVPLLDKRLRGRLFGKKGSLVQPLTHELLHPAGW